MRTKVGSNEGSVKIWLWALSATYFFIYVLLLLETKACTVNDGALISTHWFLGFWDQFFACRTISELGDALAGAFAPVAFIWLAGAVFIQSQELSETREVMQQQLEATRAQVEETKASTALFRKQTELAEREQLTREQEIVDAAVRSAIVLLPQQYPKFYIALVPHPGAVSAGLIDDGVDFSLLSPHGHLDARSVSTFIDNSEKFRRRQNIALKSWDLDRPKLVRVIMELDGFLTKASKASDSIKHEVSVLRIKDAREEIDSLLDYCDHRHKG